MGEEEQESAGWASCENSANPVVVDPEEFLIDARSLPEELADADLSDLTVLVAPVKAMMRV